MVNAPTPTGSGRSLPHVARAVLRDGVQDQLVDMLLGGALEAGTTLSIDGLARELGVSPTPVREALVHLEHTGLVSRIALRGYRVAPPLSRREIGDLADARTIIELGALDRALEQRESLLPLLSAAHQRHVEVVASLEHLGAEPGDDERITNLRHYFEVDWAFHITIIDHADNQFVHRMADSLGSHVHRLRQTVQHGLTDAREAIAEHARVLTAIQNGDDEGARRAMHTHIDAVRARSIADLNERAGLELP